MPLRLHVAGVVSPAQSLDLPTGIIVSSSAAVSPSEGTSSDSCLPFSASEGPAGLGGGLATPGLLGTSSPVRLASPFLGSQSATPVLQSQAGLGATVLPPVSFQEGRRASDTSLTQGKVPSMLIRPAPVAIPVLDGSYVCVSLNRSLRAPQTHWTCNPSSRQPDLQGRLGPGRECKGRPFWATSRMARVKEGTLTKTVPCLL